MKPFAAFAAFACLILLAGSVYGQDKKEAAPQIVFPAAPQAPVAPSSPIKLAADQSFVIRSAVKLVVVASPEGLVNVAPEGGPIRVRGKFTDGAGKWESRTYAEKYIYFVEPLAAGRCELIVVTDTGDVIRKVLDVGGGPGPLPPDPIPPDPKPDVKPTGLRVILVREVQDPLTKEQTNIWNSTKLKDWLDAKVVKDERGRPAWRKWDKDIDVTNETVTMRQLWEATRSKIGQLPAIVIVTDQQGLVFPLPATEQATLELLQKYAP